VLHQGYFSGFSVTVVLRNKAQLAATVSFEIMGEGTDMIFEGETSVELGKEFRVEDLATFRAIVVTPWFIDLNHNTYR
jgi:hypothetical protein